jgi:CO dehydrogenase maturation factor
MPIRISFSGKGGTGKTTLSALLIDYLTQNIEGAILAVDADPNCNLNELLGMEVEITLGEIRDELKKEPPQSMARYDYVEMRLYQAVIEDDRFDLIVMGQPEGPGCYCAAHAFLSQALEKMMKSYEYLVIDNEAGMEHISRLNLVEMEHLVVVSDASNRGILTAIRIADIIKPLQIQVEHLWLIVNRCPANLPQEFIDYTKKTAEEHGFKFLGFLPEDPTVLTYELKKTPVFEWKNTLKTESFKLWEKLLKEG